MNTTSTTQQDRDLDEIAVPDLAFLAEEHRQGEHTDFMDADCGSCRRDAQELGIPFPGIVR